MELGGREGEGPCGAADFTHRNFVVFGCSPKMNTSGRLGNKPGGEVYSTIEDDGLLDLSYYGGSIINLFDPQKPFREHRTGVDCNTRSFGTPWRGTLATASNDLRP